MLIATYQMDANNATVAQASSEMLTVVAQFHHDLLANQTHAAKMLTA